MASANDIIEAPTRIEPTRLEETPEAIADAIAALSSASAALGAPGCIPRQPRTSPISYA